jgi:hypothetical protein
VLQKVQVEEYFDAEKAEALLFMIVGAAAIVTALGFWLYLKTQWAIGFVIPLVLLGIVQITVGWTVYKNSDRQRTDVIYAMDLDPASIRDKEVPRMQKVMHNFLIYRYAEIFFCALGIVLVALGCYKGVHYWWNGLGLGLMIQSIILLVLDFFAEKRGVHYLNDLIAWVQQ